VAETSAGDDRPRESQIEASAITAVDQLIGLIESTDAAASRQSGRAAAARHVSAVSKLGVPSAKGAKCNSPGQRPG